MKSKKIIIGILLVLLVIIGIEGMIAFRAEHRYYGAMLLSWKNFALIISAALAGLFPLRYVLKREKLSFKGLILNL